MSIKRQFQIIFMLFKMKLAKNMAFRFSFFGVFFVDGSLFLIQLLMFSAIYSNLDSIGGWDRYQMLFFIGTFSLINALSMMFFFFGVISIPTKIKSGELDLYITKPVNMLFHLSFESIDIGSLPLVLASIGLLFYATSGMSIQINSVKIIGYVFLIIIMTVLWYDIMIILRTIPFFTIQASSIERLEGEIIVLCMKIPGTLFKGAFKVLFYFVLPYGIIATIPSQFFIGTLSFFELLLPILIVTTFTIFAHFFWRFGLKNYKSASS